MKRRASGSEAHVYAQAIPCAHMDDCRVRRIFAERKKDQQSQAQVSFISSLKNPITIIITR